MDGYVRALCQEIEIQSGNLGRSNFLLSSIYFGGGTPSLLTIYQIKVILDSIQKYFQIASNAEITLEANPGTVSSKYFSELLRSGVNRLSLGVQSLLDNELSALGRIHNTNQALKAYEMARASGIENISMDFIFGIPGQTIESWADTLGTMIELKPEHLSLYSLILEEGTPLEADVQSGVVKLPDEDTSADMFEMAMDILRKGGYYHYEISNWAGTRDLISKHNSLYWNGDNYLGIGAGAHSYIDGARYSNVQTIEAYTQAIYSESATMPNDGQSPACNWTESLSKDEMMQEFMMLGLRRTSTGVSANEFQARFCEEMGKVFSVEINKLLNQGLIEWTSSDRLCLSSRGILLGNQVFREFV
jgi:oxygen-independent coproporphyrinogen-3 oxidase